MTKGLKRVATVAVQILILLAIIIGVAFYNDADSRNAQPGSVETFTETAPATQEATASQPDASNHYVQALDSLRDRKSTRLNSSHVSISYAVFCLKKKNLTY